MASYIITRIHCVARVTLNSLSSCLIHQSSGIIGLNHQTQFKELIEGEKEREITQENGADLGVRHMGSGALVPMMFVKQLWAVLNSLSPHFHCGKW